MGLAQSKSFSRLRGAEFHSEQIRDHHESLIRCEINRVSHRRKLPDDDQEDETEPRELIVGFVTHSNETPDHLRSIQGWDGEKIKKAEQKTEPGHLNANLSHA